MENQSKSSFIDKPKKLHNGEYPDGHDNGDDDDLVHVGEGHHDEVSIGGVIVHLYHPRDHLSCAVVQPPLISELRNIDILVCGRA